MSDTSDRISEENSKKIYEKAKQHSDKFELNTEYTSIIDEIGKSHENYSESHKDRILRMAKILDQVGDVKKEKICAKVCKDLDPHGIKERYVRKILPDEYKNQLQIRTIEQNNVRGPRAANQQQEGEEKKQPLLITNNGEIVEEDNSQAILNEIYGGKSFSQMKKEAAREIKEDQDETLQNPKNNVPLLTDIPPDVKEILAENETMKLTMNQLVEDRDHHIKQYAEIRKKYDQLRGGAKDDELRRLKVENNNLHTLLSDVDKDSLAKEGYKEIEVLKMESGTVRLLNEISNKSQRTFFLLVHPKTMQIKGAKTDVQMHSIQAKREAGVL